MDKFPLSINNCLGVIVYKYLEARRPKKRLTKKRREYKYHETIRHGQLSRVISRISTTMS
jgi:hypothetical protein